MSNEIQEACNSVLTLLVALSDEAHVVAGYSQIQIAELIYGSQYRFQAGTDREPTGLVSAAIKTLKTQGHIEVIKDPAQTCNSYRVLRGVTDEEKEGCRAWYASLCDHYAEEKRLEAERQRKAEEERQARSEAERQERAREEARLIAERDQFEAEKAHIAARLEEIGPALKEQFNVEVTDVTVAFGYPALRARFTLITDVATISSCALFARRGAKPKAAGPAHKTSVGWNSYVELAPDLASWLGAALLYALDGGKPPNELIIPPRE